MNDNTKKMLCDCNNISCDGNYCDAWRCAICEVIIIPEKNYIEQYYHDNEDSWCDDCLEEKDHE